MRVRLDPTAKQEIRQAALFSEDCRVMFRSNGEREYEMRSSLDINQVLLRKALKASGLASKRAVVEEGLRMLIKAKGQRGIRRLRGKIIFEGCASDGEIGERLQ